MYKQQKRSDLDSHADSIDVNDRYQFLKQIGKGSYGEVWLVVPLRPSTASKSSSKQYVLKRLDLRQSQGSPQNDIEGAEREAKLLSTLKHPNIVAYTESFRSSDGFLNIVMAYCEGGDLYTKLKERKTNKDPLGENQIIEWTIQICMALQYMHERSILHRDLKTQNIFLTKNEIVKVGDLGIARVLDSGNDLATTIIGTPYYMSPEIFSHRPYGQKSDIWALGCCVFEMTTLEHAFNAKDMNSLMLKIIRGQTPQTSKRYSDPLTSLIKTMLSKNPDDRPTAKKILQNPFIQHHIMQLVEKTKVKCHSQNNGHTPITVVTPCVTPSPPAPPINRVLSSSDSNRPRTPHSSASSPSSKKHSANSQSTPILPSYPPLPPSQQRRSANQAVTSSSAEVSRSVASNDAGSSSSDARARRRSRRANVLPPTPINEEQINMNFYAKISQNDTLQRFRREQLMNHHVKQHQQVVSSEDEHESSPRQAPLSSAHSSPVAHPSHKLTRPSSAASSFDDEAVFPAENESSAKNDQHHSDMVVHKSYDSSANSSARQRRRDSRMQSSIEASNQEASSGISRSTSQDSVNVEAEKKKEGEKEINDFLFLLTATLKKVPASSTPADQSDFDRNESTNSSNESDKTMVANEDDSSRPYELAETRALAADRTAEQTLQQTNRMAQRCEKLKEQCLREISPDRLRRVLNIIDQVSETQITNEMIKELGTYLYNKYSAELFVLKFYEQNLNPDV